MDYYLVQHLRIRSQNDELRTKLRGGTIHIADRVRELGSTVVAEAILIMSQTDCYDDDDHDCGGFYFCSRNFRWWITREKGVRTLYLTF